MLPTSGVVDLHMQQDTCQKAEDELDAGDDPSIRWRSYLGRMPLLTPVPNNARKGRDS